MRMVWQDMSPFPTPRMDAEEEREMRLAAQARAGAEWALAALIARYQPPVLRYLTRLTGNPYQSHRMAERIFVRMERRLRGPHGAEHLRLWLLRAATEAGLDVLRNPKRSHQQTQLNAPTGPRGLLMDGLSGSAANRVRAGLGKIAEITGTTRRQVRQLIWSSDEPAESTEASRAPTTMPTEPAMETPPAVDPAIDTMNPQEELRHRLIRAVLAELPYGDAQCLALHLVAGLNQTEVARALGIRPSAARHRIVQGLQMFAHRYDATITSLGVPAEVAYAESADALPAPDEDYSAPAASILHRENPVYAASEITSDMASEATQITEPMADDAVFPEVYAGEYDRADVVSASVISAPDVEPPAHVPTPLIVDALPAMPTNGRVHQSADDALASMIPDEVPDEYWLDQPTIIPVLSGQSPAVTPSVLDAPDALDAMEAESPPIVPVLTPSHRP